MLAWVSASPVWVSEKLRAVMQIIIVSVSATTREAEKRSAH
jgi:hypothetical protein